MMQKLKVFSPGFLKVSAKGLMEKLKSYFPYKKGFLKVTAKVKKTKRLIEVKKTKRPNAKVKNKNQRRQQPGLENQV